MDGKVCRLLLIMSMHNSMRDGTWHPAEADAWSLSSPSVRAAGALAVHGRTMPLQTATEIQSTLGPPYRNIQRVASLTVLSSARMSA